MQHGKCSESYRKNVLFIQKKCNFSFEFESSLFFFKQLLHFGSLEEGLTQVLPHILQKNNLEVVFSVITAIAFPAKNQIILDFRIIFDII